jgi:hypothetical protein
VKNNSFIFTNLLRKTLDKFCSISIVKRRHLLLLIFEKKIQKIEKMLEENKKYTSEKNILERSRNYRRLVEKYQNI